uniref:Uncharacterized protein n=1 Tax=Siphoviridae sp. ctmwf23 TaxID=2827935 RepID=A0A8S5T7C5_9CAUD|nr:MAG TPA: Protein of unknown function (DUF1549) [Siphoviridae sp. ctmwf23]
MHLRGGAVLFYWNFLGILNELFCGTPQACAQCHDTLIYYMKYVY